MHSLISPLSVLAQAPGASPAMASHAWALPAVLVISLAAIGVAVMLRSEVLAKDRGTPEMQAISDAIQEGAEAFMGRMNKSIFMIASAVAVLIFILYIVFRQPVSDAEKQIGQAPIAIYVTVSFILGAASSAISGFLGMWIAIRTNIRTAAAAIRSTNEALVTALRGGAVSGIFVVALSLLGVGLLFALLSYGMKIPATSIPYLIVGYGFGASLVALFAQLGGGIYTKAADVGADLVGKVEAGIPEDDPRNPAVIADLVGDNVGDCAGRGADLFESTAAENIGAMILGVALYSTFGLNGILFPLFARALGLIASIIGIYSVKMHNEDEDPMEALNRGYGLTTILAFLGFGVATYLFLNIPSAPDAWWKFLLCGMVGLANSYAFVWITQYYTEYKYRPVQEIAEASQTGPATNIIAGMAVGLESTGYSVLAISLSIVASYLIGGSIQTTAGADIAHSGLFGTAVATMGMLGTAAYILAMDTFGPITDNAGGIVEMSQQPEEIRRKTDKLDAVGNTTKALTKGYAIGSAALAAFLLFSAYLEEVNSAIRNMNVARGNPIDTGLVHSVNLADPLVFTGALLGGTLVFIFSSMTIRAVGKAAYSVIQAVREQFKAKPGIMDYSEKPDYAACVDIVTQGALEQMRIPGLLVVFAPIVIGLIFKLFATEEHQIGAETVAGFLMVATIAGILMAMLLNNSGGAWDNAKKYIEMGNYGGKKSEPHKAAVVGDTVGDPFKDTAGPSLHVLIKLLATITLVMAPFFLK